MRSTVPDDYRERYNAAPQQRILIARHGDEGREGALARWGLLPHWAKDERIGFKMINARAETLAEKPAFCSLIGKYRCLVVADGFYEWRVGTDGKKEPLYFQLADGSPFAFAGLWTSRTDPKTQELIESCTIITTHPNSLVAPIHDRMPAILSVSLEEEWLDPGISKEHALALLQPYDSRLMRGRVVSRLVNSIRNEGPELLLADADPVSVAA